MAQFFPTAVYLLCFLTSSVCAFLLARNYRRSRATLLLWSSLCFVLLAGNNLMVLIDLVVLPEVSFRLPRHLLALSAVAVLLFGFIWDMED